MPWVSHWYRWWWVLTRPGGAGQPRPSITVPLLVAAPSPTAVITPSVTTMWPVRYSVPASSMVAIAQPSMMSRSGWLVTGWVGMGWVVTGTRHPSGGQPYRVEDLLVTRAPAQVAPPPLSDVGVGRHTGGPAQEVVGLHDQPRCAEAALHRAGVDERLLNRVQRSVGAGHPLHGDDIAALCLARGDQARTHRHVVEQDRARAAFALLTRGLGTGQCQPLTQHVEQALALPYVVRGGGLPVDGQRHAHCLSPLASHVQVSVRRASTDRACLREAAVARTSSFGWAA